LTSFFKIAIPLKPRRMVRYNYFIHFTLNFWCIFENLFNILLITKQTWRILIKSKSFRQKANLLNKIQTFWKSNKCNEYLSDFIIDKKNVCDKMRTIYILIHIMKNILLRGKKNENQWHANSDQVAYLVTSEWSFLFIYFYWKKYDFY